MQSTLRPPPYITTDDEASKDAFKQVNGCTDQAVFHETLDIYGIEDPVDYFPKFVEAQAVGYRARADEMHQRAKPSQKPARPMDLESQVWAAVLDFAG